MRLVSKKFESYLEGSKRILEQMSDKEQAGNLYMQIRTILLNPKFSKKTATGFLEEAHLPSSLKQQLVFLKKDLDPNKLYTKTSTVFDIPSSFWAGFDSFTLN
jgi:hypothetical protein